MSTQENTVHHDPGMTKDTDTVFTVSDTENQDPQSTEYNTTPEVVEYQQAEEAKQSLEQYGDLLRAAAGSLNRQTEAVMNVHLAQIDGLLGKPAMGMEAFTATPRSALQPSTITLEALNVREDALCQFLNSHPTTTRFHSRRTVSLEEAQEEVKKNGNILTRFFRWLMTLIEKAKEWFADKWQALEDKCDEVKDTLKFMLDNAMIRPYIGVEAWANGEYIARTTDREATMINWLERTYFPWNVKLHEDAVKFLDGYHQATSEDRSYDVEDEVDKWAEHQNAPTPPDVIIGGNRRLVYTWGLRLNTSSGSTPGETVNLEHMPETAMSRKEAEALVTDVRKLIKQARTFLSHDPYEPIIHKVPEVNASGEVVDTLFKRISPQDAYRTVWTDIYKSLHAKVIALSMEASQASRQAVNAQVDKANEQIEKRRDAYNAD